MVWFFVCDEELKKPPVGVAFLIIDKLLLLVTNLHFVDSEELDSH